jgi:histidine ammonia-lyase
VRGKVPPLEEDRAVAGEIETVAKMIEDDELIAAVENAVGELG